MSTPIQKARHFGPAIQAEGVIQYQLTARELRDQLANYPDDMLVVAYAPNTGHSGPVYRVKMLASRNEVLIYVKGA